MEKPTTTDTQKPATPKKAPAKKRRTAAAAPRPIPVRLDEADVVKARASSRAWERTSRFALNEFFVHAKFGVGYVTEVTENGYIVCLFEDGETRKLIHAIPQEGPA